MKGVCIRAAVYTQINIGVHTLLDTHDAGIEQAYAAVDCARRAVLYQSADYFLSQDAKIPLFLNFMVTIYCTTCT